MKHDHNKNYLDKLRHSAAHLLAAAVLDLYPNAKPTLGPPIEDGFYYDFDFGDTKVSDEDLIAIEKKMLEIVKSWKGFEKNNVSKDEATKEFENNEYKKELIEEFSSENQDLTVYQSGKFRDLCRGGHIDKPSKELKHIKLLSIAGAYWRGDEKNKMLTRIYGTAFPTNDEQQKYLKQLEEAKKRDHRKLGQELDLFSTNDLTGPGLILWHPKLSMTRNVVEQFWREEHYKRNYQLVFTPHIASMNMFVKSRHYNKYIDSMFPAMLHQYIEGESKPDYVTDEQIKPMNCPNHIQIYKDRPRSYRELPLRMGELGTVYRYERKGTLHGMTRVRGFTQDDSHIFCAPDQAIDEIREVIQLTRFIYDTFGFTDYQAYLSTRPKRYLGTLEMWDFAEGSLKKAMDLEKLEYKIDEGEGVFYGPKIDSKIKDSLGREWQLGTIQFDFNMPADAKSTKQDLEEYWAMKTFKDKFKTKDRLWKYLQLMGRGFDVQYIDNKGEKKPALMIHRTVLGSMERFFGVLIEHFAGAFPTWLAPVQVRILPITERNIDYAKKVFEKLKEAEIRVELDVRNETLQAKIRDAQNEKVNYMLVVGDKEQKSNTVTERARSGESDGPFSVETFIKNINKEIEEKIIWKSDLSG